MSEVNGVSNVDWKNVNTVNAGKNSSGARNADFSSFLGESKSLDEIFDKAAKKYDVPVNLLKAIGKAESDFNANAVSRCGAQGVMQLMPATAASLGVTDAFDPEQNIMGGAKYISGLLKKYNGDTSLALAAYNAGSGNVAKYGGIPPFKETQNYVVKVTNYMGQEINAGSYESKAPAVPGPVQVPAVPPVTVSMPDLSDGEGALLQDMDAIFSYDDYLLFLEELTKKEENEDQDKEDANYYASKSITYNMPVINLFNSIHE